MITIRISQVRFGNYLMIRRTEIPEELLVALTTYIYMNGGIELEKNHFRVQSPLLLPLINELEKVLEIKFVEEKGGRVN